MIELNLLPDVKKEFIKAQRTRNVVVSSSIIVSIVAVGAVAFLATTVYGAQNLLIGNLKKDIQSNHQKLASKNEINKYLAIQSQLDSLNQVSGQRAIYGRVFDYLQQLNPAPPSNITIYSLELLQEAKSIKLSGSANNFEAVNNFKYTLQNASLVYTKDGQEQKMPLFSAVVAGQPALTTTNGVTLANFTFDLTYAPEAFSKETKDPKITVPKLVTSDGDQNAPKELFGTNPQPTQETTSGQ
jgi:Tfp pilus assembly protein PilN